MYIVRESASGSAHFTTMQDLSLRFISTYEDKRMRNLLIIYLLSVARMGVKPRKSR